MISVEELDEKYIINTYGRQKERNLFLVRGEGVYVWDEQGRRYLDFVGGLAVNLLGHCYPAVVIRLKERSTASCSSSCSKGRGIVRSV